MNLVGLSLISCGTADLVLAAFVFHRRRRGAEHFALAAVFSLVALWTFSMFGISVSEDVSLITVIGRLTFAFGTASATSFLVFTWVFPLEGHPRPALPTVVALVAVGVALVGASLTPLVQASVEMGPPVKRPVFGPLYPLVAIYVVTAFVWSLWNLFQSRLRTPSGRERIQLNYVLVGFGFGFVTVTVTHFIMPMLTVRRDSWLAGGAASALVFIGITSYAILRHRLMGIGVAFRNVLIRGLMSLFVGALVLVPFAVSRFTSPGTPLVTQVLAVVAVVICLTLFLPDVERWVTRFVDHRLFRGLPGFLWVEIVPRTAVGRCSAGTL